MKLSQPSNVQSSHPVTDGAPDTNAESTRKIGFWLFLLILFLPVIGAWFTLRKGYSKTARTMAFAWMLIYVFASAKDSEHRALTSGSETSASAGTGFSFAGIRNMSCRDDGTDPKDWDDGTLYLNFLSNGQLLMNMKSSGATFSGNWTSTGSSMSMNFLGGVVASGEVVAFKQSTRKDFTGAKVKGKGNDGSILIRTQGFALDCLVN